jgi:hypothetical protein
MHEAQHAAARNGQRNGLRRRAAGGRAVVERDQHAPRRHRRIEPVHRAR